MQIGKRIRLELRLHQGKTIKTIQEDSVQRRVHLRSHQGKTINAENNMRRFRNFEQFTRSARSIQSSMVDTCEKGNFNRKS